MFKLVLFSIGVIKLKITKSVLPEALHNILDSVTDEHEAVEEVASRYDLTDHNRFYLVQRKHLSQDVWLATERVMFIREAKGKAQGYRHRIDRIF